LALTRYWAPILLVVLAVWSLSAAAGFNSLATIMLIALLACAGAFLGTTLYLQSRTRRSTSDAPFRAFRLAMIALLASIGVLLIANLSDAAHWPVLAGVLVLHGGLGGATSAMLYKIVPFLSWLNLTQTGVKAPNVKKLLPEARVRAQLRMHAATLAMLVLAALIPALAPLAGLMLVIESAWLLANLIFVVKMWRNARPSPQIPA
ncbi:MAG: hypothetical protein CVU28_07355, partial [Betaproteobacteria bacterium HGW-Betaproteobacteria-21]